MALHGLLLLLQLHLLTYSLPENIKEIIYNTGVKMKNHAYIYIYMYRYSINRVKILSYNCICVHNILQLC